MFSSLILIACGVVLLIAGLLVLTNSHTAEVSARSVAALLFSAAGLWCVSRALTEPPPPWGDLALPLGVSIWVVRALWCRRGRLMRRTADWAAAASGDSSTTDISRGSWLGPDRRKG